MFISKECHFWHSFAFVRSFVKIFFHDIIHIAKAEVRDI